MGIRKNVVMCNVEEVCPKSEVEIILGMMTFRFSFSLQRVFV